MCTDINHNYGVPINGIPPLLAVPLSGIVRITVKDSQNEVKGETTATSQGEWRDAFCLDNGSYSVEFSGNFRPIGTGFRSIYNPPISFLSIPITIPLIPVAENADLIGATGPMGPVGPIGESGSQGLQGELGTDGATGVSGLIGATGPQGIQGTRGLQGSRGTDGRNGINGRDGQDGNPGPQGSQGITGDSCDIVIGTPDDGYISDGLLSWQPYTSVCNALDGLNEILAEIAPAKPLSLASASLAMTGVTAFNGNASDKEYQNYKSAAGESVDGTYTGGKIVLSDAFTLTNPTVGNSEAGGDDTFYPGDEGTLSSRITADGLEEEQGNINLVSAYPNPDSSLTLNAQNSGYNSFTLWVRGDATIDVETYLSTGYNKIVMRHNPDGTNRNSADYEVFYDDESSVQTVSVATALAENTNVYKELSGIRSYTTLSLFVISGTYSNMFNNTYQTDAFNYDNSFFPGTSNITIPLGSVAWNNTISSTPVFDELAVLSDGITYGVQITISDQRSADARASIILKKPGRSDVAATETSVNRLVDTFADSSTDLDEPFDDENYRQPNYDHDSVPTALTGNWDSSLNLVDGEATVFHGSLYHGSSSSLPGGGNFTARAPIGPDYSGFVDDAVYVRAFEDDGDPHSSGILELTGLSTSDISPLGSGNVNVEIKLPTETGWLDLGTPFNVSTFAGVDGDGCQTAQSGNDWSFTFGTLSTADSDFIIIVRITIRTTTSVISRVRITDW